MTESQEQVWDEIAGLWSQFRTKPYQDLKNFLKNKQGNVLDLGCGSGRHFKKINGIIYGVDFSQNMLDLAKKNAEEQGIHVKLTKAQAYELPFEDNFFDAVIFIATLHCIEKKEKRKKALQEVFRVMKPESQAILTVWSKNHQRIKNLGDSFVPWTRDNKKYMRYYYIYTEEEIKELLQEVGFKIISFAEDDDMVLVIKKP